MGIKGFQGTSLLDFPGRIASLVFWGGCNLTCPFCHNPALVLEPESYPDLDRATLLDDLAARRSFIDGVVVSGGEPTVHAGLKDFLTELKRLGLQVKLDTNGLAPQRLAELLQAELVDYVAIDLKTSPRRYAELHSAQVAVGGLLQTLKLCAGAAVEIEYRTTCVPGWVDEQTIHTLGRLIEGTPLWALQQYHPQHALCEEARQLDAFPARRVEGLAEIARGYAQRVIVRGV
jgi:pyruvate formate lyase activating enzyme